MFEPTVLSALFLAVAVTLHNIEEMIWLPGFTNPPYVSFTIDPFAFRFAASVITLLFWLLVVAIYAGAAWAPAALAGFAAAMIINAFVPHTLLTIQTRRYHPGTATAWLLVVPAAGPILDKADTAGMFADRNFVASAVAAFLLLAISVPALHLAGRTLGDAAKAR